MADLIFDICKVQFKVLNSMVHGAAIYKSEYKAKGIYILFKRWDLFFYHIVYENAYIYHCLYIRNFSIIELPLKIVQMY